MYQFPDKEKMAKKGIKAIWLQYYAKEWSQVYNADFSIVSVCPSRYVTFTIGNV